MFVSKKGDEWASICIKGGKFDGVIYNYGKVSVAEKENDDGNLPFRFQYTIIDNMDIPKKKFNDEFFTLIGDILVEIIDEQAGKNDGTIEQHNRENDPIQPNNE